MAQEGVWSLHGAPAELPPACETGKAVAAGSVVWRGGVGGKVVWKEPEPRRLSAALKGKGG